jgi:alpha-tubulin suppressor-like RCC1 family protein
LSEGEVYCWGANDAGQLGDGTNATRARPGKVADLPKARAVATGDAFSCAVLEDGAVRCWGDGTKGQLGDGAAQTRAKPTPVSELMNVTQLEARGMQACARKTDGSVLCWGETDRDVLRKVPSPVFGLGKARMIAIGRHHGCATVDESGLRCWGSNALRQLGAKGVTKGSVATPEIESDVSELSLGDEHSCALTKTGDVWCWGGGLRCIPGDPQPGRIVAVKPAKIALAQPASQIASAGDRTCARLADGAVVCLAPSGDAKRCTANEAIGAKATALFVGAAQTCIVTGGALRCVGKNATGELGDGTTADRTELTGVVW